MSIDSLDQVINLADLEELAHSRLDANALGYYASGARDEITLGRNEAAFEEIAVHYRVLARSGSPELSTTILGSDVAMPIGIAPTAFHRMAHADGELATTRAADDHGVLMTLSTLSMTALEDVAQATAGPRWFQLYVYRDRDATLDLIRRAETAAYRAIVLTVDAPRLGVRERDVRHGFSLPPGLTAANLTAAQMAALPQAERESGLAKYFADLLEPDLDWTTLRWLVDNTDLPVVVKGIVRADDALRAIDHGAQAIWVSNHGGRQLDTSPASIEVLPAISDALGSTAEIYVDGGVRRGTDVVKALALGAQAVFVGRPVLWGLASGGRDGVNAALRMMREELSLAMSLCGTPNVASIGRWLLDPNFG